MSYPVSIDRRVFVPTGDGERLCVTLYLPDAPGDGPFPVVIESLPYRKDDDCFARDYRQYTHLAQRGIAGIRVDVRGTGASTGVIEDEYVLREQLDNVEVMEWAAAQPWCSGRMGMWGISWGGFSALQTAMLAPPHLGAIAAMHATHDRFACDVHYTGGSAHAAEQLDWPGSMVTTNALPPDPDIFGDGWLDEWMRRLDRTPQWTFEWLRHQQRDDYWAHGSPSSNYASVQVPTLIIGGWLDGYVDGMLALAERLDCPTRAVIGPWGHYRPATGKPGPTYDHFDLLARWFGHHLRDDPNDVMSMPAVTIYARGAPPYDADQVDGEWRSETAWPPPDAEDLTLSLDDMEHGTVNWSGPQWVGSHAPFWDRGGFLTTDPAEDDGASMTFDTDPLAEALEILGTPRVCLSIRSSEGVGLIAARLLAVEPGGRAHLICRGSRNLAFPGDLSMPIPVPADDDIVLEFPLRVTSARLPAGWRLRLALSGADFPVVWPPSRRFALTLDPTRCSLTVPTVPARPASSSFDPVGTELPPGAPVESTRSFSEWELGSEGEQNVFRRTRGDTELQPERGDLVYETDQTWTVSVTDDDPGTTRAHTESRVSLRRPGWDVAAHGTISIEGRDTFEVTVELSAIHNGIEIFRRRWQESIPRVWS